MTSWPVATLGEIADKSGGEIRTGPFGSQLHSFEYTDDPNGIPVVMPLNMSGGRVDLKGIARITAVRASELGAHVTRVGDVLLSRRGDIGRYSFIDVNSAGALCGTGSLRVSIQGSELMPEFLCLYLETEAGLHELQGRAVGSTMPNINAGIVRSVSLPLPPLPIQRKVAAIIAAYDDLIENNTRRITILEEMAVRIYREWFVDFRYPGHENVPLVDSELGLIPRGWVICPLSSLCERITDGAHLSPKTTDVGKPMASVKDMTPRHLDLQSCRRIGLEDFEVLVRQDCRPRVNDVLVAKDGSYLKHVFVVRNADEVVILSSIALLRPNGAIQPDVLALCLQQPETKGRLRGFVSGVAIPRIVLKDFRSFPLVLPPDELQADLVERVGPVLALALALDKASAMIRRTRDLLLPRLVSGEIDVANLDVTVPEAAA